MELGIYMAGISYWIGNVHWLTSWFSWYFLGNIDADRRCISFRSHLSRYGNASLYMARCFNYYGSIFHSSAKRSLALGVGSKKTVADNPANPTDPNPVTDTSADSKEDYINTTSVFGGAKKNMLTKNFKGGEIVNIFGGTELNLSQADVNGEAVVEMTTIFGGTTFIVPSNWTVKSDAA